jgi:multiple sugar transport system permease protein
LASSDKAVEPAPEAVSPTTALGRSLRRQARPSLGAWRSDGAARWLFIWPTVLVVLALSIFPLIASLTLSFGRLVFERGRIDVDLVGFANYAVLLFGTERSHLIGVTRTPNAAGLTILGLGAALMAWMLIRSIRGRQVRWPGVLLRLAGGLLALAGLWLLTATLASDGGRPGSLVVTVVYVVVGIVVQYALGLGLALLAVQPLAGRRFFRIVFLLPLTITPIGVGYMFRMITDTSKGPLEPVFEALGMGDYTWVTDPWASRVAVLIGETWMWTPFVFIVLLAALEGLDQEVREAALVDGASRFQAFRDITLPALLPVSTTIVLIRLIEGFKIVDMPNILTGGGPGTATQSLTLQAYLDWRTLNLGRSAAIAYILLILVTIVATAYVAFVRRRVTQEAVA